VTGLVGTVFGIIPVMKNSACLWKGSLARSLVFLLVVTPLLLVACSSDVQKPAPQGDHAVLEQLAQAYRTVSERYPVPPQTMRPGARKDFLAKVFARAGYSYSATLIALGQSEARIANQDHRDLVDLLLMPSKGLSDEDLSSIYNADEQVAVWHLRKVFR